MDLMDAIEEFSGIFTGGHPFVVSPKSNTLGAFNPGTDYVKKRDESQIVRQTRTDTPLYLDGGDSAHRTGVLAFCNSSLDKRLLEKFEPHRDGLAVRHPSQPPYDRWQNFSRDQLVAFAAGCWRAGRHDICVRLLERHRLRGWRCQNTEEVDDDHTSKGELGADFLLPHDIMFLRICAGIPDAHLDLIGQMSLQASLEAYDLGITTEKNQPVLQSIVCGRLNVFLRTQPRYRDELREYWTDRRQDEIGDALIRVIEIERRRYKLAGSLPPLLPRHLLLMLKNLKWAEVVSLDPAAHLELAKKVFGALIKDGEEYARSMMSHAETMVEAVRDFGWNPFGLSEEPRRRERPHRFRTVLVAAGIAGAQEIGVDLSGLAMLDGTH